MKVRIIGGGLAGCEAAYQLLKEGVSVEMYEMRPNTKTPCHNTGNLAELVCSNSLKSTSETTAHGLLKLELETLDSLLLKCAKKCQVEAGSALAVDRERFSKLVYDKLVAFKGFTLIREEIKTLDSDTLTIVATGPLTSDALSLEIQKYLGEEYLYFFDAIAPIVDTSSLDFSKLFWANRYDKGNEAAYLNAPMTKEEYENFYKELLLADRVILKEFEKKHLFSSCQPIEIIASTGINSMRWGPLKPVGLERDGKRAYAVVQLRKESNMSCAMNMVGFQTNLTYKEQKRVFSLIPGFEEVEFFRYGSMHRNTYINSRKYLNSNMSLTGHEDIFFAGQITGVEGYVESIASGLICALSVIKKLKNETFDSLPKETMIGALINYITSEDATNFQPMASNYGLLPPLLAPNKDKNANKLQYKTRALNAIIDWRIKNQKEI